VTTNLVVTIIGCTVEQGMRVYTLESYRHTVRHNNWLCPDMVTQYGVAPMHLCSLNSWRGIFDADQQVYVLLVLRLCTFVSASEVINERLKKKDEAAQLIKSVLAKGETIPDELVLQMIGEKIRSAEVAHQGSNATMTV